MIGKNRLRFACNRGHEEHIIELDGEPLSTGKTQLESKDNYAVIMRGTNDKVRLSHGRHQSAYLILGLDYH